MSTLEIPDISVINMNAGIFSGSRPDETEMNGLIGGGTVTIIE